MLTQSELHSLVGFRGYGSLSAQLWFLGLEEGLGPRPGKTDWSTEWELHTRSAWDEVMDLQLAHLQLQDFYWERKSYTYVWKVMAHLARGILRQAKDWKNRKKRHDYVINQLGRSTGETFLGEAMPFPAPNTREWPYTTLFPSREYYQEAVWPHRRALWAQLVEEYQPKYIICYGMGVKKAWWLRYQDIFPGLHWELLADGRVLNAHYADKILVYLTPFFGYQSFQRDDIRAVIDHAVAL